MNVRIVPKIYGTLNVYTIQDRGHQNFTVLYERMLRYLYIAPNNKFTWLCDDDEYNGSQFVTHSSGSSMASFKVFLHLIWPLLCVYKRLGVIISSIKHVRP